MLKNIKSSYFIKIVFSYLDEGTKLKIIKYNKIFQNKFGINLINYKLYSGRYIIYETKEKGKEYNAESDNLIFEGEYLNGKRNGKGKEYFGGDLIFEGEYLNGKRNGKGKEYDFYGKVSFEGEYLNDKRNGKGKIYNKNDKLEIEYINGEIYNVPGYDIFKDSKNNIKYKIKDGKGYIWKYFDDEYLSFEGEYLNGEKNGKGIEYYEHNNKPKFKGEYLKGKRWNGKEYDENGNTI